MLIGIVHFHALLLITVSVRLVVCAGHGANTVNNHDIRPIDWQTRPPSPDRGIDWDSLERHLAGHSSPTSSKSGADRSNTASSQSASGQSSPTSSSSGPGRSSPTRSADEAGRASTPPTGSRAKRMRSPSPGSAADRSKRTSYKPPVRRRKSSTSDAFLTAFQSTAPELHSEYLRSDYIRKWPTGQHADHFKLHTRPYKEIIQTLEKDHPEVHQLLRSKEKADNQRRNAKPNSIPSLIKQAKKGKLSEADEAKLAEYRRKDALRKKEAYARKKSAQQQQQQQ